MMQSCFFRHGRLFGLLGLLLALAVPPAAHATAPSFTGLSVLAPLTGGLVNLRSQGAISGSAPMTIQSVSILPIGIGVSASIADGVCVQITNTLGIDLASVGAVISVVATNADAPRGVRGTIAVLSGLPTNNNTAACADPSPLPVPNAGGDRTVADQDNAAGEAVTLDASASVDPDGTITSYLWTDLSTNQTLGAGARIQPILGDGSHQIQLTVTDNTGGSASTVVNVVVQAAAAVGPTPNAGGDRSLLDTDNLPGEIVTLDASASIDVGGQIVSYEWLDLQQNVLGTGVTLTVRLPDGLNDITLRVTSTTELTNSINVKVSIAAPNLVGGLLASIPNLTEPQRAVASALDDLCARLTEFSRTQILSAEQVDLLNRCGGLVAVTDIVDQVEALDQLGAKDFNALGTQAIVFSTTQYLSVMDHLASIRSGARGGLSLSGLAINSGDRLIPIEQLQEVGKKMWGMLGGAASADSESGSLLSDRLGLWLRGNYDRGDKAFTANSDGFDAKQWGMTGGIDYRFGRQSVLGTAVGYGKSELDFRPFGRGGLATKSWTGSLYGSTYPIGNLYVDAVFNYGDANYATTRNIVYQESGATIARTALGSTGGKTLSGGVTVGYDINLGGFTVSPRLGYFLSKADIDSFDENGAGGLDLAFEDQSYASSTMNLGVSANYAWNTRWFVLLPHLRGEYVHEFNDDVEAFGVRFAHDPFADAANPTAPMLVRSETPDQWYWRFAGGVSAQFKYGFSGYAEYQRLENFQYVSFENVSLGLRFQGNFQ